MSTRGGSSATPTTLRLGPFERDHASPPAPSVITHALALASPSPLALILALALALALALDRPHVHAFTLLEKTLNSRCQAVYAGPSDEPPASPLPALAGWEGKSSCLKYVADHMTADSSKRPQPKLQDIPESIWGAYVFIPTQKMADVSLTKFR